MFRIQKGFTILELTVVLALMSVLVAITVPSIAHAQQSSRNTQRIGVLGKVKTELSALYAKHNDPVLKICPPEGAIYFAASGSADCSSNTTKVKINLPANTTLNEVDSVDKCGTIDKDIEKITFAYNTAGRFIVLCKEGGTFEPIEVRKDCFISQTTNGRDSIDYAPDIYESLKVELEPIQKFPLLAILPDDRPKYNPDYRIWCNGIFN